MDDKIRLGIVTDSATCDTGYGKIAREVFGRLILTDKFEISQLGWWHNPRTNRNAASFFVWDRFMAGGLGATS